MTLLVKALRSTYHYLMEQRLVCEMLNVYSIIDVLIEGPRTKVGQPKMKCSKLHKLHKNVHPIIMSICPNLEQLLKHILRVFPSLGGGGKSILWG